MNASEKKEARLLAMEAYELLDSLQNEGIFSTVKNFGCKVTIDDAIYNKLVHLLRLVERIHVEGEMKWFEYGEIPYFSVVSILKEFH